MNDLPVKEMDFDTLKEQFVEFLKTQTQFKDFNYDGTNINVLLSILAYNTHQNAFQTNMAINEMFLDSANLPTSVASHAKFLNYIPKSAIGATAILDVELSSTRNDPFLILPAYTKFTSVASVTGKSYTFYTRESIIFDRKDGAYRKDINVYEGGIMEETFYVRDGSPFFELSRDDIDISSVKMIVEDKNANFSEWVHAPELFDIGKDSKVFFLQTSNMRTYEIYFGENNFGTKPTIGSKVRVTYFYTSGPDANGISKFQAQSMTTDDISSIIVRGTSMSSRYGSERETAASVKANAPLANQVQRRAIVESDYVTVIRERFPQIQSVTAIGGEKLSPPEYGKVAIVVDMAGMDGVPQNTASAITEFLRARTPMTVDPIVKAADFTYVAVSSKVKYDISMTESSVTEMKLKVLNSIIGYSEASLDGFNKTARLSVLQSAIDKSDASVLSNDTKIRLLAEVYPEIDVAGTFRVNFGSRLIPQVEQTVRSISGIVTGHPTIPTLHGTRNEQIPAIMTTQFFYNGSMCYITDDGFGSLNIVREAGDTNVIITKGVGTVNYDTGLVIIRNLTVTRIDDTKIKVYGNLASTDMKAPLGTIIKIRKEDVNIEMEAS